MFTRFSTGDILLLCAFMVFTALLVALTARSIIDHLYEQKTKYTKKIASAVTAAAEVLSQRAQERIEERE